MSQGKEDIATTPFKVKDLGWVSAQIVGSAAALYSLYRGLTAFKIDPAVLLASTAENFKLKTASAQTSFRSRFATEFEEVTRALPYTMVIVIDDLDRCQPATVLTIMEAVNFLVSSGNCFIIFGMATNRVEAALVLEFEKIADELAALNKVSAIETGENSNRHRLFYVRDYLDKLINLEIIVPNRSDILPSLLDDVPIVKSPVLLSAVKQYLEFWPSWLAMVLLSFGLLLGVEYNIPKVNIQKAPTPILLEQTAETAKEQANPSSVTLTPISEVTPYRYIPEMQENKQFILDKLTIATTLILIAGIVGSVFLFGLRASLRRVHDSQRFREALRIWTPVVQCRRVTPRAVKRFGNRLRYMAMLQQHADLDETGFDKIRRRLMGLARPYRKGYSFDVDKRSHQVSASVEPEISEPLLVALASLYEIYGPEWRAHLKPNAGGNLESAIQDAIKSYELMTQESWPPGDAGLSVFERLLKGIRLA